MKTQARKRAGASISKEKDFFKLLDNIKKLYKEGNFENIVHSSGTQQTPSLPLEVRSPLYSQSKQLRAYL